MTNSQFIFCFFAGSLLLAIGLLTTTLLSTNWFFVAIGGCLCLLSLLQFKRAQPKRLLARTPKSLPQQK